MAIVNAPQLIATPPAPPRPYGLFDVALGPMPFPEPATQAAGIQYVPDTCEDDVFLYQMNCPAVSGSKTFSLLEAPVSGAPFGVITSYTCGAIGFSFAEVEQRVRTRMALREQRAVERRVWQGLPLGSPNGLGGIPGLFQSATTLSAASCLVEGVRQLEQAMADAGVIGGIIHARPGMAAYFDRSFLLQRPSGRTVVTSLGTPVVFGQGYDGSGPQGQAATANDEYIYGSGRILIWGSDTVVPPIGQTMNRSTNQLTVLAERIFAVTVECGVWAVQVTRNCAAAS